MNSEMEHYLDMTARNYLKAKKCEELSDEIKGCYKIKIKATKKRGDWNVTNTIKNVDAYLLANALEFMAKEYRQSSAKTLKMINKVED